MICSVTWNIVISVDQKDEIVLCVEIGADDFVVKGGDQLVILQPAVSESQQVLLMAALRLFTERKFEVQKIFPDLSRESLFEDIGIFVDLFLGKREKRLLHLRDFIFVTIHIAAADPVNPAVVGLK